MTVQETSLEFCCSWAPRRPQMGRDASLRSEFRQWGQMFNQSGPFDGPRCNSAVSKTGSDGLAGLKRCDNIPGIAAFLAEDSQMVRPHGFL